MKIYPISQKVFQSRYKVSPNCLNINLLKIDTDFKIVSKCLNVVKSGHTAYNSDFSPTFSPCLLGFLKSMQTIIYIDKLLNPKFHWLHQIASTLHKFHWQFWIFLDAIAKAKKLFCESIAQNLKWVSLTKRFFSFGNGV